MELTYSNFTTSKNGLTVPLYKNGHAAHSRYNPEREAETAVAELPKSNFYVLIGFGAGYVATAILKKNKNAKIFAIEKTDSDIKFLLSDKQISQTASDGRITLISIDQISQTLPELYLPSVYGDLQISVLRSWAQENEDAVKIAKEQVENTIKLISADYSVQAHFGKNWQRNILCNLRNNTRKDAGDATKYSDLNISVPTEKIAFVAGAGPSLEKTSELLKKNREKYFVIATDTAYGILTRDGIFCDMAVCIDSQNISHSHFLLEKKYDKKNCDSKEKCREKNSSVNQNEKSVETIFVFDIASAPCVIRSATKKVLITTGHPLVLYAEQTQMGRNRNFFPKLFSGAGTVTIAATDLARSLGFKNIVVAGADFSYINGKSYSRGSYLDTLYNSVSTRMNTAETQFDALMFRTPLYYSGKRAVSKILEMYQKSFEEWDVKNGFRVSRKDDLWHLTLEKGTTEKENENIFFQNNMPEFDFPKFQAALKIDIENDKFAPENPLSPLQIAVLPYVAHIRRKNLKFLQNSETKSADKLIIDMDSKNTDDFNNFLKIAYKSIVTYTGGEK